VAKHTLSSLEREITKCARCPRLVDWRERVSTQKHAVAGGNVYWSRPVPAFGPSDARLLIVGLAPGAHGANRTGRPFTGDGAGPLLYGALHRAGLASRALSVARDDDLELFGVRITNAVRCVPPGNRPLPEEVRRCSSYLARELAALPNLRVVLCLGAIAWNAVQATLAHSGIELPRPRPPFGHGAELDLGPSAPRLVGAYHPSQLNTRTGRLSTAMFDAVVRRAWAACDADAALRAARGGNTRAGTRARARSELRRAPTIAALGARRKGKRRGTSS
jgi:uracil-DNA glycosylase family 4